MTYYGGTGYGTTRSSKTECHWGNPLVFTTHDGIEVHAGGSSRGGGWWKMDPLPDLAMGPDSEVKKGYSHLVVKTKATNMDGWSCLDNLTEKEPPAVLEMDFPDYNVPQDCDQSFWEALAKDIREKGVKVIHVMCMGGHGRTGIQLACLRWHLANEEEREAWPDAYTLVMAIREPYCDKAVEADSQQTYVAEMCGIPRGENLPFHKGYGTVSYSHHTPSWKQEDTRKSLTASNRKILSCDECDFVCVEDKDDGLEEDEYCYDYSCRGMLVDITDDAVSRVKPTTESAAICLTTMDITSELNILEIDILSEELMERIHGEDWEKVLQKLMSNHKKTTLRGKLIRQIALYFSLPEEKKAEAGDILVCVTDITCDPRVKGFYVPDYTKKGKDTKYSSRAFCECGFCKSKLSPNRMTYAHKIDTKTTTVSQMLHTICLDCIVKTGPWELDDRLITADEEGFCFVNFADVMDTEAEVDIRKAKLVGYLSPQHVYSLQIRRVSHKGSSNETKSTREALEDLGLHDEPIEEIYETTIWEEEPRDDDDDDDNTPLIEVGGNGR